MSKGKYFILIGNYGSGKTEIALNLVISAAAKGLRAEVVDLDKVNDYFRLSDRVKLLEDKKVNVVTPTFASKGVTPTNMSAAVASAFDEEWDLVVFDVGGDSAGAMSLGRYYQDFSSLDKSQLEVIVIVNVFRPMSEDYNKIIKLKNEMESFSRLHITGFINNSNLLTMASVNDLKRGYEVLAETSERTNLPVLFTTATEEIIYEFSKMNYDKKYTGVLLPITLYMHRNWNAFTTKGI